MDLLNHKTDARVIASDVWNRSDARGMNTVRHLHEDGSVSWESWQDKGVIRDILDDNKRARNEGMNSKSEMRHVASIPSEIELKWIQETGDIDCLSNPEFLRAKLNDPEWSYLKRTPLKI